MTASFSVQQNRWNEAGECGSKHPLLDGTSAECDPNGDSPCCNNHVDGECGNTTEHCSCEGCVDYSRIHDEWRDSGGEQRWRYDGKCGSEYPLPNGAQAQCNPDGDSPCCNHWGNGQCGNTTDHCSCKNCTDYKFEKEWRESGAEQRWRNDGKCGSDMTLPDFRPAECDPDGDNPCCDHPRDGQCGNKTEQCTCDDCVDYSIMYKDWREYGHAQRWRYDRKCGSKHRLIDGGEAMCNPDGDYPCCDNHVDGRCGSTKDHCSCRNCTDYKFEKEWRESGAEQSWRNDGKCGSDMTLPDLRPAECDPDGDNPCCDHPRDGECGNKTEHCSCEGCVDYSRIYDEWRDSGGEQRWRYDGKCGSDFPLPNGVAAKCNPDGDSPCCDSIRNGQCGNTTQHCNCDDCVNYAVIYREWRDSDGEQRWRYDGKCGSEFSLPDGSPAECDPDGENPCCYGDTWSVRRCGSTSWQCDCFDCIDFKLLKDWRESEGEQKWRYDGKCGSQYPLPDGRNRPSECDPDSKHPCCHDRTGQCGNTAEDCFCDSCTDYKFVKEWRESGGDLKWRNDGRCGFNNLLPDGSQAQCDPDGDSPCCDSRWDGKCGNTTQHCTCFDCVNYAVIHREWRDSDGQQRWRYDGNCGSEYPLPDGSPAECNPDGENPCCPSLWHGVCGNTTQHCNCQDCLNYGIIHKEWRQSGGMQKWRYDGKCGDRAERYSLPDRSTAECNPEGENPCCNNNEAKKICGKTMDDCVCASCIDYRIVKRIRDSGENCTEARLATGFLKNVCFDERTKQISYKCAFSDVVYTAKGDYVTDVCKIDPHAYQACGVFGIQTIKNAEVLCGGYICEKGEEWDHGWYQYIKCTGDKCRYGDRNCNKSSTIVMQNCDGKCDEKESCKDEASCNGYEYGIFCKYQVRYLGFYIPVYQVCHVDEICKDESERSDCVVNGNTSQTCIAYFRRFSSDERKIVPILNYTRCSVFDFSLEVYPYCLDYLDQTNCSDINRVGGYCQVRGYFSSVSKFVVCYDFDWITEQPIKICDDNLQNECVLNFNNCTIHKHKMCDGSRDCFDGSDEDHDMCGSLNEEEFNFTCTRRFNFQRELTRTFPIAWIMDGQVDCMNGEDEDSHLWKLCKGKNKRVILQGQDCQNAFKCPGLEERYVPFDQLCDGVESCGDEAENDVCATARDLPLIKNSALQYDAIRDVCKNHGHGYACKESEFTGVWGASNVFGVKTTRLLVPTTKIDCTGLFGEHYLFLSCMTLCAEADIQCPLGGHGPLMYDSCPQQFPDRTYTIANTIANNSFLVFIDQSDSGIYHQEYYQCKNSRCVQYKQVCNLIDDCGDMSDEINCKNHMICQDKLSSAKHQFISLSQKCDGMYDCFDLSDECNDECGREILENWVLKISCWLIGTLAMSFNFFTVVRGIHSAIKCQTENMLTSKVLMSLIGLGDFLIGLYLVILSVFDTIMGKDFCKYQAEWLTGTTCTILGVISTLGSQISLFTMTVLSVIRMYGLIFKAMRVPGPVNIKAIMRVLSVGMATIMAALTIALVPLTPSLEDYFVQGMYYNATYKVFIGFPNKEKHIDILQAYHEKNTTGNANSSIISPDMSWRDIGERVDAMFSQDYGSLARTPVHFYGNDGLCLFKYFVRNDDARRSRETDAIASNLASYKRDPVVWTMLAVNFFCFVIITCCYIVINIQTKRSSQRSGQQDNPERLRGERAIQKKIMIIITTDFLCWVPFIAISAMHSLDYINATSWYATFALTVLPLNSVINPLVYDKELGDLMTRKFVQLLSVVRGQTISTSIRRLLGLAGDQQEQDPGDIPIEIIGGGLTFQNQNTTPRVLRRESSF